jgi:hypothetical protein
MQQIHHNAYPTLPTKDKVDCTPAGLFYDVKPCRFLGLQGPLSGTYRDSVTRQPFVGKQGFPWLLFVILSFSIALEPNWTFMIRRGKMIGLPQLLFIEPMTI